MVDLGSLFGPDLWIRGGPEISTGSILILFDSICHHDQIVDPWFRPEVSIRDPLFTPLFMVTAGPIGL